MISSIIQARITSTRLPNKVLMDIEGKPMVLRVVERLRMSKMIDLLILAIPDTKENDILESFCKTNKIKYFRSSEEDVLKRYYLTAKHYNVDTIVRITSDCPFIDPVITDKIIKEHIKSKTDYTSNVIKRTFPRGFDTEVFSFFALEKSYNKTKEKYQREHVTPYFFENPNIFSLHNVVYKKDYSDIRLTVDTKEDMELARKIYNHFKDKMFFLEDII